MAAVLCVDCKNVASDGTMYVCNSEKLKSPVDGSMTPANAANAVRANMALCGPEGRWYEPLDVLIPPMPQANEPTPEPTHETPPKE